MGEWKALYNLGNTYNQLGECAQAINFYQQTLTVLQTIRYFSDAEEVIIKLINCYCTLQNYKKAVDFNQHHLALVLAKQAKLYQKLGESNLALEYCDRALSIATDLGIPLAKECEEFKEKLLSGIPQEEKVSNSR